LWLFKHEKVTLAKAAELANMGIYDFIAACKENQLSVINISEEELVEELHGILA
jgi:predicted HTH domain antitoxin